MTIEKKEQKQINNNKSKYIWAQTNPTNHILYKYFVNLYTTDALIGVGKRSLK